MTCKHNNKCCNLYDDIDDDDNQYLIDRLEDIIEICEFLIQVTKHKKMKKDTCDTILKDLKKENEKEDKEDDSTSTTENPYTDEELINIYRRLLEDAVRKRPYPYVGYPYTNKTPKTWEVWF